MRVRVGDVVEVPSTQVGGSVRRGEVLEVLESEPLEIHVRWDDGNETTLRPAGGTLRVVDHTDA
ncbi:MAG: DUF1918 domain-containing protein [Actinomycetota bacterium]|nr:DUF1918 domain-containing protein [Actinomycetota bacterium]